MEERDKQIVSELRKRIPLDVLNHLKRLIVFGSRARGEGTKDSDLDIAALVDEKTPDLEKSLDEAAYAVMWDYDFKPVISIKVFSESRFRDAIARGFSFYSRVEREGVSL